MIKVYINGEWLLTFDNQEQVDIWVQACDCDYLNNNDITFEYEEEE